MKKTIALITLLCLANIGTLSAEPTKNQAEKPAATTASSNAESQNILFKLDNGTNDLHPVVMALKLATHLSHKGADVTIFANLEGVRIFSTNFPENLNWGGSETIVSLREKFIAAGGKILICPHCAAAAGLEKDDFVPQSSIGTPDSIADHILAADKVISY